MNRLLIALLAPMLLAGCATMNRSECQNADWHMIGMEDGMKGRAVDYIGNHRRSCAKQNITPNLNEYSKGHEEGVRQFCSPSKGFEAGQRGVKYNGVCPPDLEPLFLTNYTYGNNLRLLANEINSVASRIESDKNQLKELKSDLKEKEDQLIREGTSEAQRALLLKETKEIQNKIERLKDKIRGQEEYREVKRAEYEQLTR